MTGEFPNPYDREAVEHYVALPPEPLDSSHYDAIDKFTFFDDKVGTERTLTIVRFLEGTDLPREIAEHLKYNTENDSRIETQTADDMYRFGDVDVTAERFLRDQGGRRLYCAIDESTGSLSGVVWIHPLQGGRFGASLVRACDSYNQAHPESKPIDAARRGTLASRTYAGTRHHRTHTQLLVPALEDYYTQWPDCEGVVIRVSENDGNALVAFQGSDSLKKRAVFWVIHKEDGVLFMANDGLKQPQEFFTLPYDLR